MNEWIAGEYILTKVSGLPVESQMFDGGAFVHDG